MYRYGLEPSLLGAYLVGMHGYMYLRHMLTILDGSDSTNSY